jgi:HEAT repeat protein
VTRRSALRALFLLISLAGASSAGAAARPSFEDLVANLKSPNAKTRQDAAAALGKSRRREAIPPLAALVRDPEVKVRLEVVRALRELRDLSAMPALVTALADPDVKMRGEAIEALVELYSEREKGTPIARIVEVFSDEYERSSPGPYITVDPSVFQALAQALRDEDEDIRESAALALGILEAREKSRELLAALQDPAPDVRGAAALAIARVGSYQDGGALIPLVADESSAVRNRALHALAALRIREAGPTVRQLFDANRRRDAGLKALECLSRIADPAQADLFRELVQDSDVERRRLAVEGLGRISDPALLPAFKKDFQRERNDEMRLAYAFALALLGDRPFLDSIVLALPSRVHGSRCRRYLLEMGPSILPDLYPYLSDPDENVRAELSDILGAMGDSESIARLTPLINDPSSKVQDRANRAVERLRRGKGARPGAQ